MTPLTVLMRREAAAAKGFYVSALCRDGADEIDRLTAEVERLHEENEHLRTLLAEAEYGTVEATCEKHLARMESDGTVRGRDVHYARCHGKCPCYLDGLADAEKES